MSVKVQAEIWQFSKQKGTALLLMLAIGDFADDDGMAFPSIKRLAIKTRISERTVQRLLAGIQATGELVIDRGQGPKGCHLFRVTICQGDIQDQKGVTFRAKIVKEKESIKEKEKNTGTINEPSSNPVAPFSRFDHLDRFNRFWEVYPRKVGKQAALKSWKRLNPPYDAVYAAVEAQKLSEQWQKGFIPNPATWLNQGRWEDEVTTPLSLEEREKLGEEHWKTVKANR